MSTTFEDPKIQKQFDKQVMSATKERAAAVKAETKRMTDITVEKLQAVVGDFQAAGHKDAAKTLKTALADLKAAFKAGA